MLCSLAFIAAQLLWYCSKFVRRYDILEVPMALPFFPLAPFFDPHNGMVNNRDTFVYALAYWISLYLVALGIARKKVNPAIPATVVLILSCVASVVYSVFFVYRGPVV